MPITIQHRDRADGSEVERILRGLPKWFGIEHAIQSYVKDCQNLPTWVAVDGEQVVGFLTVKWHFPHSAEILVMGVDSEWHRQGIGRALVEHSERWLRERACLFFQVKTVSASSDDPSYAKTRRFYLALGFLEVEEFPTLWDPTNPALLLLKALEA